VDVAGWHSDSDWVVRRLSEGEWRPSVKAEEKTGGGVAGISEVRGGEKATMKKGKETSEEFLRR